MNEARCFYVNIDLENMPRKGKQWNSFVWGDHKQSMDQKPFGVELVTKLRKVSTKVKQEEWSQKVSVWKSL